MNGIIFNVSIIIIAAALIVCTAFLILNITKEKRYDK